MLVMSFCFLVSFHIFLLWLYCQRVFCFGCTVKGFSVVAVLSKGFLLWLYCQSVSSCGCTVESVCQLWLCVSCGNTVKCVSVVVVLSKVCVGCGCAVRSVCKLWLCCQKCVVVLSEVCVCAVRSVCQLWLCYWKCVLLLEVCVSCGCAVRSVSCGCAVRSGSSGCAVRSVSSGCAVAGDVIAPGDILCDIQTDKAVVGMEYDDEGILAKILVSQNSIPLTEILVS